MSHLIQGAQFEKRPAGAIILDGQEVAHTLQCCHCYRHFISQKGSGKIRGYCMRHRAITCGSPGCNECIPAEAKLEFYEGAPIHGARIIERLLSKFPMIKRYLKF